MQSTRVIPLNWSVDETGEPWLISARQRARGTWKPCEGCHAEFAGLPRARFCSSVCASHHMHSGGNQHAFARWTAGEAWLAGLIWADGSLVQAGGTSRGQVKVCGTDAETIEAAGLILGVNPSVYVDRRGYKPVFTASISGLPVARLRNIGLSVGKTYKGGLPDLNTLGHAASFVRGFFDGDGSVGLYVNPSKRTDEPRLKSQFVGTKQSMTDLREILVNHAGVRRNKVCGHTSSAVVSLLFFNHADSLRLADYMYSEAGPCLGRKRDIFIKGRALCPPRHILRGD